VRSNSLKVIREWATYHMIEIYHDKHGSQWLHKYKLCCVCYALLCEDHFIRIKPGEPGIYACTKLTSFENKIHITTTCTMKKRKSDDLPCPCAPFKGTELPWDQLFQHCESIKNSFDMIKQNNWVIKDYPAPDTNSYTYTFLDLKLAMIALADHIKNPRTSEKTAIHNVKTFFNEDNELLTNAGVLRPFVFENMKYFVFQGDYEFVEMRVVANKQVKERKFNAIVQSYFSDARNDSSVLNIENEDIHEQLINQKNLRILKTCRFIFAKFNGIKMMQGILFYTDNHYGQNLVSNDDLLQAKLSLCSNCNAILTSRTSIMNRLIVMCKECSCNVQKILIDKMLKGSRNPEFPYKSMGKLTLHYNQILTNIDLVNFDIHSKMHYYKSFCSYALPIIFVTVVLIILFIIIFNLYVL